MSRTGYDPNRDLYYEVAANQRAKERQRIRDEEKDNGMTFSCSISITIDFDSFADKEEVDESSGI